MAGRFEIPTAATASVGSPRLGLALTVILVIAYFGFIVLGAFAPAVLAQPLRQGGTVTVAFAYGLAVIALGVVLTGIYVLLANRMDPR